MVVALKLGYEVTAVDFVQHCIDDTKSRVESIDKEAIYISYTDIDVIVTWGVFFAIGKKKSLNF